MRTVKDGRHRGRAIKHDHAVDIGLLIDDLHCRRKAVAIGIADDVHRIAMAPGRRTHFIQLFDCLGSQIGKRAVEVGERIDRHHAGAAAVGDDHQPVAGDARTIHAERIKVGGGLVEAALVELALLDALPRCRQL